MIYILSDDGFFSSGLQFIFKEREKDVCVIDPDSFEQGPPALSATDIVYIAIEDAVLLKIWLTRVMGFRARVVVFVDVAMPARVNCFCQCKIISKKTALHTLFRLLSDDNNRNKARYTPHLSRRETDILTLFSGGWNAYQIASRLHICDKAVSLHKKNALQKLGLNHLTAQSVLIYANVYRNIECSVGIRGNESLFRQK